MLVHLHYVDICVGGGGDKGRQLELLSSVMTKILPKLIECVDC
jgi:hypothetical protein